MVSKMNVNVLGNAYRMLHEGDTVGSSKKGGIAYCLVKRVSEIVFIVMASVVLVVPVRLACPANVADSSGAPLFRKRCVRRNDTRIYIFKFWTMVFDAHVRLESYLTEGQFSAWQREQKLDDGPYVTKVGSFLRGTSLDEVPQFINGLLVTCP